jgi:hypothetical protein
MTEPNPIFVSAVRKAMNYGSRDVASLAAKSVAVRAFVRMLTIELERLSGWDGADAGADFLQQRDVIAMTLDWVDTRSHLLDCFETRALEEGMGMIPTTCGLISSVKRLEGSRADTLLVRTFESGPRLAQFWIDQDGEVIGSYVV